ncbi:hypothetical protein C453_13071 [Haloferax elongans ATCC BAA-1513]|uniref:Uncharacterized protein n=1 Tax=Haloferax elongans ATCC BAA-1513 TaxID=1230453 RepID=M0HIN3_HALEO|nr:hypothetical protein [Haloferax elongans]ELZ82944.1 hypothetical protein C453_13071 [Haloferax elongans ATCC BAA-1513]
MSDAASRFVEVFREFGGDALRDVWVFDRNGHQPLYLRDDIESAISDIDVSHLVDNERFGYITRDTYEALYYADYSYTIRGFDAFEQFRTFVGDTPVGVFAGFDVTDTGRNFAALNDRIQDIADDLDVEELLED